jgi:hypothetical protein
MEGVRVDPENSGGPKAHGPVGDHGINHPSGLTHERAAEEGLSPSKVTERLTGTSVASAPIWFRSETSLWHIWKLTPEGREGIQWTECLEMIDNPVHYAPAPSAGQEWRGTGHKGGRIRTNPRVCRRCADFAFHMRKYWILDRPHVMVGEAPTMIGPRHPNASLPRSEHGKDPMG